MGAGFWVKRFLLVFVVAGAALGVVELLKGRVPADAARFALLWGAISAAVYTLVLYVRYRRNPACVLPRSERR